MFAKVPCTLGNHTYVKNNKFISVFPDMLDNMTLQSLTAKLNETLDTYNLLHDFQDTEDHY